MRRTTIVLLLMTVLYESSYCQRLTRPHPESLYDYEFELIDTSFNGCYLTVPLHAKLFEGEESYKAPTPMILDRSGFIVLYLPNNYRNIMDFNFFSKHHLYSSFSTDNNVFSYHVYDTNFRLLDIFKNSSGVKSDAHEFQILRNGNYLIGGQRIDTLVNPSLECIGTFSADSCIYIRGYIIEEFDSNHDVVFTWNSNDHIDPLDALEEYGYKAADYDYCHGNSIEEDF